MVSVLDFFPVTFIEPALEKGLRLAAGSSAAVTLNAPTQSLELEQGAREDSFLAGTAIAPT